MKQHSAAFCAVCIADLPPSEKPRYAPLGRDGAQVRLCVACDSKAVRVDGNGRAYRSKL